MEIAVLALGCFWGPEVKFNELEGVKKTEVGYCGGLTKYTNYEEVCSGKTNHAEVVKVEFDKKVLPYEKILEFFFKIHDPTTLNRQGLDIGTQYRSEIFYTNDEQRIIAQRFLKVQNEIMRGKIVTKISKFNNYSKAEEYHQKYLLK